MFLSVSESAERGRQVSGKHGESHLHIQDELRDAFVIGVCGPPQGRQWCHGETTLNREEITVHNAGSHAFFCRHYY